MEHHLSKEANRWVAKRMSSLILRNAELVSDEEFDRREKICLSCPNVGTVMPLPNVTFTGCTLCGCPLVTKLRAKVLMRDVESVGKDITISEIVKSPFGGDYVPEEVRCANVTRGTGEDFWALKE